MDISPRSLQRQLATEGISFSEVVDQWRFKTTLRLLEHPGLLIREISDRLGYSNVPNFERAFHRWTKTSAQSYREARFDFGVK